MSRSAESMKALNPSRDSGMFCGRVVVAIGGCGGCDGWMWWLRWVDVVVVMNKWKKLCGWIK